MELQEDFLSDVRLKLGSGAAEDIETDVEPFVYCGVDGVIFVAELLRSAFLYQRFCL